MRQYNFKGEKDMTKKSNRKFLSLILSMMLIVAMAFSMTACGDNNKETPNIQTDSGDEGSGNLGENHQASTDGETHVRVLGEGAAVFYFDVTNAVGEKYCFEIHTDKTVVGDALLELKLIAGEEGEFGLYVKEVNGITADYNADGTYWCFYINGEYAMTGVDATNIEDGATYSFKVEK